MLRVLLVIGAILASSPAFAGWFGYSNYDDCLLDKMKGQVAGMFPAAHKACARQFKIEQELAMRDVDFTVKPTAEGVTVTENKNKSEFIVTRVELEWNWDNDCFMAQVVPMSTDDVMVAMKNGTGALTTKIHGAKCIAVKNAWGIYK